MRQISNMLMLLPLPPPFKDSVLPHFVLSVGRCKSLVAWWLLQPDCTCRAVLQGEAALYVGMLL